MTSNTFKWLIILGLAAILAAVLGCSTKDFSTSTTSVSAAASPVAYIPLQQGHRVNYKIVTPEEVFYSDEVTDPVNILGSEGYTIRRMYDDGRVEYSYRYAKGNAIFETSSTAAPGARILESPFVIGNSWNRYDTTTTLNYGNDEEFNDFTDKGTGLGLFGDTHKERPDEGAYSTMEIVNIESVATMDGNSYGGCIKVAWQTSEDSYNYYWYAAGIGLVKFEHVTSNQLAASSNTTTLMTDWQEVEY